MALAVCRFSPFRHVGRLRLGASCVGASSATLSAHDRCYGNRNITTTTTSSPAPGEPHGILHDTLMFGHNATESFQHAMITFHDMSGLPWWATIALGTIGLRGALTTPLYVYQQRSIAKLEVLQSEIRDWTTAIQYKERKLSHMKGGSPEVALKKIQSDVKAKIKELCQREGIHPLWAHTLAPVFVQIPVWITMSFALRGLTTPDLQPSLALLEEISSEGTLWFQNLVLSDIWYGLPLLLGASTLLNFEITGLRRRSKKLAASGMEHNTSVHKNDDHTPVAAHTVQDVAALRRDIVTGFFRLMPAFMIVISSQVPVALTLYWTTSSMFAVVQNLVFMYPNVRSLAGIKPVPGDTPNPIQSIIKTFRHESKLWYADYKKLN